MSNRTLWGIGALVIMAVAIVIYFMSYAQDKGGDFEAKAKQRVNEYAGAILKTNFGDIEVEFYSDKAPLAVVNFTELAEIGFYNEVKFHRVINGFMIQAGDPLSKEEDKKNRWGTGGPGYTFKDEINPSDAVYQGGYKRGTLAMANAGPDTNGSQFFIVQTDYPLPPQYTIFGKVVSGMDVVDKIAGVEVDGDDKPLQSVVI